MAPPAYPAAGGVPVVTGHRGGENSRPSLVVSEILGCVRVPPRDDPGGDREGPRDQPGPRGLGAEAARSVRAGGGAEGPRHARPHPPEGVLPHCRRGTGDPRPTVPWPTESPSPPRPLQTGSA